LQALYQFDLSVAAEHLPDVPKTSHTRYDATKNRSSVASGLVPDVNGALGQRIRLAGCDEAGRGALAGPAAVACVHIPVPSGPVPDVLLSLRGVDDSKRLTPRRRALLFERITQAASFGIGWTPPAEIDRLGIVLALKLAARRAYIALGVPADLVLLDRGLSLLSDLEIERLKELKIERLRDLTIERISDSAIERFAPSLLQSPDHPITQPLNHSISQSPDHSITQSLNPPITQSFTRGDSRSLHIAAASIIAKVARDRLMVALDRRLPGYGFGQHKGYGTPGHRAAILRLGPSPIHRRSFKVRGATSDV